MAQFDSPSEAALLRIKSDDLQSSPVDGAVEKVANIGGFVLEAIGFTGASKPIGFLSALKKLAAGKDEANLIYFGDALVDDIRRLYQLCEDLSQQFDKQIQSAEFNEAVANATLHITRTNVENRLMRLAHLITNGIKESDLEPEGLDDMMRAAVELTGRDVEVLGSIYEMQKHLFSSQELQKEYRWRLDAIRLLWENLWDKQAYSSYQGINGLAFNSSCARLQSAGLIIAIGTKTILRGPTMQDYELLPEGKKFYERLQEIAAK